jgi:hypothetical protein
MKVLTTPQLKDINEDAKQQDFNRILADEFVNEKLDPEGFHVAKVVVPFHERHHFDGEPVDDVVHHRLVLLCKTNGTDEPETAFVDVSADEWDALADRLNEVTSKA